MKAPQIIFAGIVIMLFCNFQMASTPESTARKYVSALESFDVIKARSLMVQNGENAMMIERMQNAAAVMTEVQKKAYRDQFKDRKHTFKTQRGDNGREIVTAKSDEPGANGFVFYLVKVINEWKIESLSVN